MSNKFKSEFNTITKEHQIIIKKHNHNYVLATLSSWIKDDDKLAKDLAKVLNEHGNHIDISF